MHKTEYWKNFMLFVIILITNWPFKLGNVFICFDYGICSSTFVHIPVNPKTLYADLEGCISC